MILVATKGRRAHRVERVRGMHVLEPSVLIVLVFSVGGLIATLSAAIVTADKLVDAWHHSEPTARGRRPKGSRCVRTSVTG